MNESTWRAKRNSRSLQYAGRVLPQDRRITVRADREYVREYDGQVTLLVVANLLARMTPSVSLDIPDVPVVEPLPWTGEQLQDVALKHMEGADPYALFAIRPRRDPDVMLHLGRSGADIVVHGSGWNFYIGPAPSPISQNATHNPIGPGMAAIAAVAHLFNKSDPKSSPTCGNALTWSNSHLDAKDDLALPDAEYGEIWTVGTGSVGTAILYFLTLFTRSFSASLFDMDEVQEHNLDRSPIFENSDVASKKSDAVERYLKSLGVRHAESVPVALDESELWRGRSDGTPDILISTANERNVRHVIENSYPPLQIYATTGKNYQATALRHIPLIDPCSICLFPEQDTAPLECATVEIKGREAREEPTDAALPFLSFAAGAMGAAEILKLQLPGYPFTTNRVALHMFEKIRATHARLVQRQGCVCQKRVPLIHQEMIEGGRYSTFSNVAANSSGQH